MRVRRLFVCKRCAGTPFDPFYLEDAAEPLTEDDFGTLTFEPFNWVWEGWK